MYNEDVVAPDRRRQGYLTRVMSVPAQMWDEVGPGADGVPIGYALLGHSSGPSDGPALEGHTGYYRV